jgi:hypothetical protein
VPPSHRRFWAAFALCAIAFLAPLWLNKYLPMIDLPQHALQLSIWQHHDQPAWGKGVYELNWRTPYLIGYFIARPFASIASPLSALKVLVSVAVLALPLALLLALRRQRPAIDDWWALLGFPVAFGYAFYWGFLNFLFATSVGICFIAFADAYADVPTVRRGIALAAFAVALLFSHAIVFGVCVLVAGLRHLARGPIPTRLRQSWPYVLVLPVLLVWYKTASNEPMANLPVVWHFDLERYRWLTALLVGSPDDVGAAVMGAVLLLLPFVALRPRRSLWAWIPTLIVALVLLVAPQRVFGTNIVNTRCASFLVPFLLLALEPRPRTINLRLVHALILTLCVTWSLVLLDRFAAFDNEARDFDAIEAKMEPGHSVRALIFDVLSAYKPAVPAFVHFPVYYAADKGGLPAYSFAENYPSLARYRPGFHTTERINEWDPRQFDWRREPAYDYYVVRAPSDPGAFLFRSGAGKSIELELRVGKWWLYRRVVPLPAP